MRLAGLDAPSICRDFFPTVFTKMYTYLNIHIRILFGQCLTNLYICVKLALSDRPFEWEDEARVLMREKISSLKWEKINILKALYA